jgi:hypothetical protein
MRSLTDGDVVQPLTAAAGIRCGRASGDEVVVEVGRDPGGCLVIDRRESADDIAEADQVESAGDV